MWMKNTSIGIMVYCKLIILDTSLSLSICLYIYSITMYDYDNIILCEYILYAIILGRNYCKIHRE